MPGSSTARLPDAAASGDATVRGFLFLRDGQSRTIDEREAALGEP